MKIVCKDLTPALWADVEELFGPRGAVGGCWCMSWRLEKGEKWDELKGAPAKKRFKGLVTTGKAHGVLAYADGEVAGWCSYDKRRDYARLDRAPSLKCDDADDVWSIPCFFIKAPFRGSGVATALLEHAKKMAAKRGATILEGYPVKKPKGDEKVPAAFAWTGTESLFAKAGFDRADRKTGGKIRVRLEF